MERRTETRRRREERKKKTSVKEKGLRGRREGGRSGGKTEEVITVVAGEDRCNGEAGRPSCVPR